MTDERHDGAQELRALDHRVPPRPLFDWQVFMSTMMAGLLIAFVVGIVAFVRAADRRDERLKAVEKGLDTLILSAHAHNSSTPIYLPDADPE